MTERSDEVADEQELLAAAPSLDRDGPQVSREADAGPTEQTMETADDIAQARELAPRLADLRDADREA